MGVTSTIFRLIIHRVEKIARFVHFTDIVVDNNVSKDQLRLHFFQNAGADSIFH
jgi:hypothetical protein